MKHDINGTSGAKAPLTDIRVRLTGANGNIFNIMGLVGRALREGGRGELVKQMNSEVMACGSYDEALATIMRYVEVE